MKITRFIAAALSATIIASSAIPLEAYAEEQSVTVCAEYDAVLPKWDGESKLKSGKKYSVSKDITITEDTVIPAKTVVVVKDGAKLVVAKGAALTIKGKLSVGETSQLVVNGSLTLNKNKSLDCSGKMKLGKNSVVKLNGRFTLRKEGSLSGKPKKITAGVNSVIKLYGENTCAKLDKAIEATQAEIRAVSGKLTDSQAKKKSLALYQKFLTYMFVEKEPIYACRTAYTDKTWKSTLDESKFERFGGIEAFARDYSISLTNTILKTYSGGRLENAEEIESIELTFNDFEECFNYIPDSLHNELKEKIGDISNLWLATATMKFNLKNGNSLTANNYYISFTCLDGQMYVATENLDEIVFA